ncbi:MAG: carotenoid biosynthesis protein [Sphingobacteriia bacterium]|nr:MAG: carotenoid biosynthesis protein [Sphingobacteriia bacterium]
MIAINKINTSTFLALLFHISGLIGILFSPYKEWFIQNTPVNLLVMAVLLFWNQQKINRLLLLFFAISFSTGMITEIIGVNTGFLFGNYSYGTVMGFKIGGVPLLIGLNWFIVIYCCIVIMEQMHQWVKAKYETMGQPAMSVKLEHISIIVDGAMMATFFDWVMEPAAVKLGFWQWHSVSIPLFNYICWFFIAASLIGISRKISIPKRNDFAVHLLIIQTLFFLTLRIFL